MHKPILAVYLPGFNKINNAIAKAGGVKLSANYYWSSIESSNPNALTLHTIRGALDYNGKNVKNYVRPFAIIS